MAADISTLSEAELAKLPPDHLRYLIWQRKWTNTARPKQIPPDTAWTQLGALAGRGFGKELAHDTPLPTPSGWTTMGDIKIGDQLFDEAGRVCRVVGKFSPPVTQAYRLTFSDGSTLDADADHQWVTWTHRDRKQYLRYGQQHSFPPEWPVWVGYLRDSHNNIVGTFGPSIRTTEEIVQTLTQGSRGDTNHCIPVCLPLELPKANLPVDPWLLGYWLGNGTSKTGDINAGSYKGDMDEAHVLLLVEKAGYSAICNTLRERGYSLIRPQGLREQLKALGLLDNKHVPAAYLRASVEQRLALLRGLMDSDGYASKSHVEFTSTLRDLADAVVELLHTLGERCAISEERATLKGRDIGPKYRVKWRPTLYNPFSLPRKAKRLSSVGAQALRTRHRMIVSADKIDPVPMSCITVDSPNSMYLAGRSMIPTHNTLMGAQWISAAAVEDELALPRAVIAPTFGDACYTCFEGPAGLLNVIPPELIVNYNSSDLILDVKTLGGKIAQIRGFSAEKPARLRGPQFADMWCFAAGTPVLMADGSQRPIEQVATGAMVATRFGARRVVAAGRSGNTKPRVRVSYGATSLIATSDHPMLTDRGWVAAGELQPGDVLWSAFGSTASRGGSAQTATSRTDDQAATSIASSTRSITAPSQKATTFTTRMVIQQTTSRVISKLCHAAITSAITRPERKRAKLNVTPSVGGLKLGGKTRRAIKWLVASAAKVLSHAARSLELFVPAPALSTGERGASSRLAWLPANNVVRILPPLLRNSGFARSNVTQDLSGPRSTESRKPAPAARLNSCRSATTLNFAGALALSPVVVSRVDVLQTREPVYDLSVEGVHEFIAGGVVVHNCDELAAWQYAQETWDMAMMGLRLGPRPRVMWTTTPKPIELIRKLIEDKPNRIIVRGSTYENRANLPDTFFEELAQYEGTTIGRQELEGELIDPEESGVIKRSWLRLWPAKTALPAFDWIIMSLDTAFTEATVDKKTHDPDYSACVVLGGFTHRDRQTGEERKNVMLLDCWQERYGLPDLMARVRKELNVAYGDDHDKALIKPLIGGSKPITSGRKVDIVVIEEKGSGISLRQMLDREGITAFAYNPGRADKLSRLHIVSPIFARRQFWVPESEKFPGKARTWVEPLIYQLCAFTGSGSLKHDDFVDAVAQGLRLLMDKGMLTAVRSKSVPSDPVPPRKVVKNPYAA